MTGKTHRARAQNPSTANRCAVVGYAPPGACSSPVRATRAYQCALDLGVRTLPSGQQITNAWNANVSPSSGAVTAGNVGYNAEIAAGGQASFGFQGTFSGSCAKPSGFSLNGSACAFA